MVFRKGTNRPGRGPMVSGTNCLRYYWSTHRKHMHLSQSPNIDIVTYYSGDKDKPRFCWWGRKI